MHVIFEKPVIALLDLPHFTPLVIVEHLPSLSFTSSHQPTHYGTPVIALLCFTAPVNASFHFISRD